jgi:hypothetical protein
MMMRSTMITLALLVACGAAAAQQRDDIFGKRVADDALAAASGGTDVHSNMQLTGSVSDTSARNLVTGDNAITGASFVGAAGLPTVIQNSGNNVLIQNATIVNVQFQP